MAIVSPAAGAPRGGAQGNEARTAELRVRLGIGEEELLSVLTVNTDGGACGSQSPAGKVAPQSDVNHYAGLCPMRTVASGRGRVADVIRVPALWADLDVKDGALKDIDDCREVVAELSRILGVSPVATIYSGAGLQPIWALEGGDDPDLMKVVMRRFGNLVQTAVARHGGSADSVFDLARMLRVPGSNNFKYGQPRRVVVELFDDWDPITVGDLTVVMNAEGIPAGKRVGGKILTPPEDWTYAEQDCPYATTMMTGWASDCPTYGRHPWLLGQAVRLAVSHRVGCLSQTGHRKAVEELDAAFTELCRNGPGIAREPAESEVEGCLAAAIDRASSKTWEECLAEVGGTPHGHMPVRRILDDDFWGARDYLQWIYQRARASMVSPEALLMAILARVSCQVGQGVVLPGVIFTDSPLAIYAVFYGRSGAGKSGTMAVADGAYCWNHPSRGIGSGEGLVAAFTERRKKRDDKGKPTDVWEDVRHTSSVCFTADEAANLMSLKDRSGSTLVGNLNTAWSGAELSAAYSDQSKARTLPAHTYAIAFVVGAQPRYVMSILAEEGAGLFERFIWVDPIDPDGVMDAQPPTATIPMRLPTAHSGLPIYMTLCSEIEQKIRTERFKANTGTQDANSPTGKHDLLIALRIAALFALMDGRYSVTEADWNLALKVLARSQQVRTLAQGDCAAEARKRNEARADREVFVAERVEDKKASKALNDQEKAAELILAILTRKGPLVRRAIEKSLRQNHRPHVASALELLLDQGDIEECLATGGNGVSITKYQVTGGPK